MQRLLRYLVLPPEVTPFEARYLARMNRIALVFFWLHPPVFALVAVLAGTSLQVAIGLALAAMVGPMIAYYGFKNRPRVISMIYGVTAMLMGGALVFIGQGPMQIEMHFYFFVLIALLAVFGNPIVIIAAAVTVAAHHFVVWLVLPRGVFNYDASFWTVAVHAIFVVIESVAAVFVARSFFDNVIGLEKIVGARTEALDARNRDMTRILDNVAQGFVSVGLDGTIGGEWSRVLATWFGEPRAGTKLWELLYPEGDAREWMKLGFEMVADGLMPIEVTIDQLPREHRKDGRDFRIAYQPIGDTGLLVVVSDVTADLARDRAERDQRELMVVVEKAFRDRAGFAAFLREADELVASCDRPQEPDELKRRVHTLKGNSAMFGVMTVAKLCHELETNILESGAPQPELRAQLVTEWSAFHERVDRVLGATNPRGLVVDLDEYEAVLALAEHAWPARVREWGKTSSRPRLEQCADYARALAERLGKPVPEVELLDHDVRLPIDAFMPVWSAFIHAIRNMVDHGLEDAATRIAAGKPERGRLVVETTLRDGQLHLEIADDGPGIAWDRIADRARRLGLPAATAHDLEQALFTIGISTRDEVSETSGRGVGMDALRTACTALGGTTSVTSEPGRGTRITCIVPVAPRRARRASQLSQPLPVLA